MTPCSSKETAEFHREKRHYLSFASRTTPFQNPATARTAGSCERTGAAKAPVLSPAILSVPQKTSKEENRQSLRWWISGPNPAHTRREGQGLRYSRHRGTQPLTQPNRGCFPSLCPSARGPRRKWVRASARIAGHPAAPSPTKSDRRSACPVIRRRRVRQSRTGALLA